MDLETKSIPDETTLVVQCRNREDLHLLNLVSGEQQQAAQPGSCCFSFQWLSDCQRLLLLHWPLSWGTGV